MLTNLVFALLVGLAAGWLAGQIMRGKGFGLAGDLVVGVLGSLIGSFLFSLVGLAAYGLVGSILVALAGALLLLYALRKLKRKKK